MELICVELICVELICVELICVELICVELICMELICMELKMFLLFHMPALILACLLDLKRQVIISLCWKSLRKQRDCLRQDENVVVIKRRFLKFRI